MTDPAADPRPSSLADAVEWLRKHFDAEAAADCEAIFAFELTGSDGGAIGIRVKNGSLELAEADLQPADLRFRLSAQDFFDSVESCMGNGENRIILDCAELSFISSFGLAMLVRIHKRAEQDGGGVCLVGLRGITRDVFRTTGLDKALKLFPSVRKAARSFAA